MNELLRYEDAHVMAKELDREDGGVSLWACEEWGDTSTHISIEEATDLRNFPTRCIRKANNKRKKDTI